VQTTGGWSLFFSQKPFFFAGRAFGPVSFEERFPILLLRYKEGGVFSLVPPSGVGVISPSGLLFSEREIFPPALSFSPLGKRWSVFLKEPPFPPLMAFGEIAGVVWSLLETGFPPECFFRSSSPLGQEVPFSFG